MAATYAALHFGKPMGETISSIFGGYILGVIALYNHSNWFQVLNLLENDAYVRFLKWDIYLDLIQQGEEEQENDETAM